MKWKWLDMLGIHDIIKGLGSIEEEIQEGIVARLQNKTFLFQEKSESVENQEKYLYCCLEKFIQYMDNKDTWWKDSVTGDQSNNAIWVAEDDFADTIPNTTLIPLLEKINPKHERDPKNILVFKYLPAMLDLNSPNVHKLLPYLLTSYICSVYKSGLFRRGKAGIYEIFLTSEEMEEAEFFDNPRPSRRKKQIERISQLFSLNRPCLTYKNRGHRFSGPFSIFDNSSTYSSSKDKRPKPYIVDRRGPYRDNMFIERVFSVLTVITIEEEKKIRRENKCTIDLKSCLLLFCHHMYPDSNAVEAIVGEWCAPECEQKWLKSFRSWNGEAASF